jgi:hypothetical protein
MGKPFTYTDFQASIEKGGFEVILLSYLKKIGITDDFMSEWKKNKNKKKFFLNTWIRTQKDGKPITFKRFKKERTSMKEVDVELSFSEFVGVLHYAYRNNIKEIQFPFYPGKEKYCLITITESKS